MKKFYGDIETIRCDYLLKATPYTKETTTNFVKRLDKDTFFTGLYAERSKDPSVVTENDLFDKKVENALKDLGNEFAKVSVLHISGYAGCGKTTYVHHLLWSKSNEIGRYDVIDYEGCQKAVEPFIERTAYLMGVHYNLEDICDFIDTITVEGNKRLFVPTHFFDFYPHLNAFSSELRVLYSGGETNKDTIYNLIDSFGNKRFNDQNIFLRFLFIVDFFLLLLYRFLHNRKSPIVLVIDNSDSMSNLSEEEILLPETIKFAKDCNYFFVSNLDRKTEFKGISVDEVCNNTKLQIIFTTRLVTERRYEIVSPDWEKINGWTSITLPENYYDHYEVITKRVKYYVDAENISTPKIGTRIWELIQIKNLAEIAYHNSNFMKLFNGSLRVCVERLYDITQNYPGEMIQELINLYSKASKNPDIYEGASGYFMSLILDYFKKNGIYTEKLDLSACRPDGTVTLSRIILTIIREKGGRCSLLDIFKLLTPLGFSSERIAQTVWNLCELNRAVWRRLIVFEIYVPEKPYEFTTQAKNYENGNNDIEDYSELVMCTAGNAYLEFVLPHFEFLHSRHELSGSVIEKKYHPLFSEYNENIIGSDSSVFKYNFETKIERVFKDVSDCCYNSTTFADLVMKKYGLDRYAYINQTFFNYHPVGRDGIMAPKQSYESRLIFRHVGYIEKYRRYLLKKYEHEELSKRIDISQRLIAFIIKYLELYLDSDKCFQTSAQDMAAENLMSLAKGIQKSVHNKYYDLNTRIELQ